MPSPRAVQRQGELGYPLPCPRAPGAQVPEPLQLRGQKEPLTAEVQPDHSPPTPAIQANPWLQTHCIPLPWHSTQCWLLVRGSSSPAFSSKHPKALN